jgi:glycine hydroxymethyltransferase
VDVTGLRVGLTGDIAQKALEDCGIIVDKIDLPFQKAGQASGIRLGTPIVTKRGMGTDQMAVAAELVSKILSRVEIIRRKQTVEYKIDQIFKADTRQIVEQMCLNFSFAD